MSVIEPEQRSYSKTFLTVTCPCGKALRARFEQAGSEIRCWACHRMVLVPAPRSPERTLRALGDGWHEDFQVETFTALFVAAAALTALLAVPYLGITLGTVGMILLAFGYGELIRRSGDEAEAEQVGGLRGRLPRLVERGLAAALLGMGLFAPFWLAPGGLGQAVRFSGLTLVVTFVALFVLPLAAVAVITRDLRQPFSWQQTWARAVHVARMHPLAVLLALSVVPLGAVLAELLLLAVCYHFSLLQFLLLDLFPKPETHLKLFHLPYDLSYAFGTDTSGTFFRMYFHRLTEGYTLLGAIPASLPVPKDMAFSPWSGNMEETPYFVIRILLTVLAATVLLNALALQARWLGQIAALETKREVPAVAAQVLGSPSPVGASPSTVGVSPSPTA